MRAFIVAVVAIALSGCANMSGRDKALMVASILVAGYVISKHNDRGGPVDTSCRRIQTPDGEMLCVFRSQ